MFEALVIMEVRIMINDETKRKLRELNFSEVIEAVEDQASNNEYLHLTFDERLQFLVDYVFQKKFTNKIEKLIKKAKFRFPRAGYNLYKLCKSRH